MGETMETATLTSSAIVTSIPKHNELQPTCQCSIIDTETTGLWEKDEIIQIAVLGNSGVQFEALIIPTVSFNPCGSAKTGAANAFISFLKSLSCQILLVGHNIVRFDALKICKWLRQYELDGELYEMLYRFCNTIPILRQGKVGSLNKLSWKKVVQEAHDAKVDCALLEHFKIADNLLKEKAVSIENYCKNRALIAIQHRNRPSLEPLKTIVSTVMLNKMARNRITLNELKREFNLALIRYLPSFKGFHPPGGGGRNGIRLPSTDRGGGILFVTKDSDDMALMLLEVKEIMWMFDTVRFLK
ncbi:hypothetical protein FQA39_LY08636 [Lamprigera yunnana]|nr:hypothetical protein FQA39_LY08636 [Lamprigera yunnana]